MRVAPQVVEHLRWSTKRRLGINVPFLAARTGYQVGEGTLIGQVREAGVEAERTALEGLLQALEKQSPKQP